MSVESPTGRVEGVVSSKLSTWWTSHPLQTSLPALRRIDAAGLILDKTMEIRYDKKIR
jgi:hypothetical protein